MKTTIELSDGLFRTAKKYAAENGMSLKSVIESALRTMLESNRKREKFTLKDGRVDGKGISPEFSESAWREIRAAIYKGRGE